MSKALNAVSWAGAVLSAAFCLAAVTGFVTKKFDPWAGIAGTFAGNAVCFTAIALKNRNPKP
jgi:uncharacterized membrane protein YccC